MTPTAHHGSQRGRFPERGYLVGTVYNQPSPVVTSLLFNSSDVYDALDRFNRIIESRWKQSTTNLYKIALGYDRNSNLLTADDSVQSGFDWKYTNDMLERLTQAQAGTLSGGSITSETRKQIFDLDQVGNWTHTDLITGGSTTEFDWDFTHNKVNEITGWDNQTNNVAPTYDAAGNMTDDKRDWKYEYDAWYRLVRVKDQSNNVKAEFVYNALGFRLSTRYDETAPWYHFAYDERWRIVAMYEDDADASEPTEQFWYQNAGASGLGGSSYIDDVILRDRDTDGNGSLDERRYYLQNQHHDVVALINTSGSIGERVNYDPYGSPIGTFTSIANRKGCAGYEYDAELGHTYHVRHRVYRSDLGVWTHRDPLEYVDGMGLYEYVHNAPLQNSDCYGLIVNRCETCPDPFFDSDTIWGEEPDPGNNEYEIFKSHFKRFHNLCCCKCLVYKEAGGESDLCKCATVWAMRNRQDKFLDEQWPDFSGEADYCAQASLTRRFAGGFQHSRYKACARCDGGNPLEDQAIQQSEAQCMCAVTGDCSGACAVDPTGGAQYWYQGTPPEGHWLWPQIRSGNCVETPPASCGNKFYRCTKPPKK